MKLLIFFRRYRPILSQDLLGPIKGSCWLLLDKFIRLTLGLYVVAWTARYLGPLEFGKLSFVIALLFFFQALANPGLDTIVVRDLVRFPARVGIILGTVFSIRFTSGFLMALIAITSIGFIEGISSENLQLLFLASGVLIFQSFDTIDLWFQSQYQNKKNILVKTSVYIFINLLKIFGIYKGYGIEFFSVMLSLEAALSALGLIAVYRRTSSRVRWQYSTKVAIRLVKECWPLALTALCVAGYMRVDQLIIAYFFGDTELGIYAAVLPISTLWNALPLILAVGFQPFFARLHKKNKQEFINFYKKWLFFAFLISITISLIISVFSQELISILLGDKYLSASTALSIHAFTNIGVFIGLAQTPWITSMHRSDIRLKQTIYGLVSAVTLNLLLVPNFGILGAAISAVASSLISSIFSTLFIEKELLSPKY